MPDRMRFIVPLLLVLAALSWAATEIMIRTSRRSLEHDVELRAQLAVGSAERDLVRTWRAHDAGSIAWLLGQIARDERILSAAACTPDLALVAATSEYPSSLGCALLGGHVRPSARSPAREWTTWSEVVMLGGGSVDVSAHPIIDDGEPLGFVVLVHDLGFIDRRGARTRLIAFAGMAALALTASVLTLLIGRAVWSIRTTSIARRRRWRWRCRWRPTSRRRGCGRCVPWCATSTSSVGRVAC